MPCTRHRVFLAALIVAAKYLNDSSPKNKHWASYAALFDKEEINLMEKQLVFILDFDLRFTEREAIEHFAPFMRGGEFHVSAPPRSKEEIRKRTAIRAQAPVTPPLAPTPPITPPCEETIPLAVQQQHQPVPRARSSQPQSPSKSATRLSQLPTRPPRPAESLYPISSSESMTSLADLTDDNGTSSSSSSAESGSDGESSRVPHRFVLRPVPLERRRKVSGPTVKIISSASVGAISDGKPLRIAHRTQRVLSSTQQTANNIKAADGSLPITSALPTAVSVPSFFNRMFGKQVTAAREEPRIQLASGNALPSVGRYREPVSHETIYDPELL